MATRKRGRPRGSSSRRATLELPPVPTVVSEPSSPDDAIAALEQATRAPADPASEAAPATGDTPKKDGPVTSRLPTGPAGVITGPSVGAPPNGNGNGHAPPGAPRQPAPAKPRDRSITGRAYEGLQKSQLRTALAIADNRNQELERQLREVVPALTAAKVVALETMTGVVISALFDFAALATSIEEVRLDRAEETELGELGAPAIAPYLGEYAQHAPVIAFLAKLTTVVTTKVIIAKSIRETRAAADGAGT